MNWTTLSAVLKSEDPLAPLADFVAVSDEIAAALRDNAPVVAMETSLVTHGLPFPQCVDVSMNAASAVRESGAVPGVIGIRGGRFLIGLGEAELTEFAQADGRTKTTLANLGDVLARKVHGGTTIATTLLAAEAAGISVFATGGLGGVHRGALGEPGSSTRPTFDISADLEQLGRSPLAVVCAGPKIILDLHLTMEYLETKGVPVMTLGQNDIAGFYSTHSNVPSPICHDDIAGIARACHLHRKIGMKSGSMVTIPVDPKAEVPIDEINALLGKIISSGNVPAGAEATPWLLRYLHEATEGRTLTANLELIPNNARKAGQLAALLSSFDS